LILDGVSEPGNMGTVIRTAEALGYDGIYITKGSADIYSPKTVRATMGSVFRMNFRRNCTTDDIRKLQDMGFSVVATTPLGTTKLEEFKTPERLAIVIGNEAHGVCDEILDLADYGVKITMDGMAESLNAAVASGIVMHWLKKR
jgi:TrmH family RNA methyltransferase